MKSPFFYSSSVPTVFSSAGAVPRGAGRIGTPRVFGYFLRQKVHYKHGSVYN